VTTGEWILIGVGAAQAIALAVAAIFAWLTYRAAQRERDAGRLQPVVRELQVLAELDQKNRVMGSVEGWAEEVAQQARLRVALDFLPEKALPRNRLLARLSQEDLGGSGQFEAARRELSKAMSDLSPALNKRGNDD
jgi:hypothetical protein